MTDSNVPRAQQRSSTQKGDRSLIDEIKRNLTIKQVIDKYGGAELKGDGDKLVGWHKAHGSTSKSSLHVNNKNGVYNCFSCGQGGDIFTYAGHQKWNGSYSDGNKEMFTEVYRELAALAGIELPAYNPEAAAERRSIEDIWQIAADFYHEELTPEHRAFLHSRYGLTNETINTIRIGYAPTGQNSLLSHLVTLHGIDNVELVKSGLFHKFDNGGIQDLFQGRYIFPYGRGGRVCYFIGRITDESPQWERDKAMKYKKLLVHNDTHPYVSDQVRNDYFYGEDAARGANNLFVTEGITDAIIANQYEFPCISPVTVRFREADWERLLGLVENVKTLYLANDNEDNEAGKKGALATAEMLWAHGHRAKMVTLPKPDGVDKVDLNDFLREQGADAFRAILATSKTLLDLRIEAFETAKTDDERIEARRAVIKLIAYIADTHVLSDLREKMPAKLGILKQDYNRLVKEAGAELEKAEARAEAEKKAQQKQPGGLPTIQVNGRQLSQVKREALDAIIAKNGTDPKTFIRNGALVRIIQDERGQYGIQDLNNGATLDLLAAAAEWVEVHLNRHDQEVEAATHPTQNVVSVVLNDGAWPGIPALTGVVTSPVFSADGTLHDRPGYNPKTKLYYTGGVTLGDTTPTPANIKRAKSLILDDLLVDFPFKDEASRAHAIAYFLLPFVRDMIPGPTPVHDADSPTPGTGKGLVFNACALAFLGHDVPTMAATDDDNEWRKRITTSLMNGSSHIVIDNVNHELDSGVLASAFTQPVWEERALGSNRMVKIPIRTVWAITANNIKMSQEIARRCLWIRLDANTEKPWERTEFKHKNLMGWARAHRNELVTAAITLGRAWIDRGMPQYCERTKGSYEAWAGVMGGILSTVGISGFLENETELYDRVVSKNDMLADFVKAWWNKYGTTTTSAFELFKLASYSDDDIDNRIGDWHNLLGDMLTAEKPRGRQTQLGRLLSSHQDKIVAGYKIVFDKAQKGTKFWCLENAGGDGVEPDRGSTYKFTYDSTILPQDNDGNTKQWVEPGRTSTTPPCGGETKISVAIIPNKGNKNIYTQQAEQCPEVLPGSTHPIDYTSGTAKKEVEPRSGSTPPAWMPPTDEELEAVTPFDDGEVTTWTL